VLLFCANIYENIKIIVILEFVALFEAAFQALMFDKILILLKFNRDWFHESLARIQSIARNIKINMFAVEALGAVIGIASSVNCGATFLANKIFNFFNKMFCHMFLLFNSVKPVEN